MKLPDAPGGNVAIGRVWARQRIAQLSREERTPGSREQEITKVALEHHLVSQYTSLVAIDDAPNPRNANGFPLLIAQPSESPEGVDLASAGGQYASAPAPFDVRLAGTTNTAQHSEVRRGGGCGACATAAPDPRSDVMKSLVSALAIFALAARRRKKEKNA